MRKYNLGACILGTMVISAAIMGGGGTEARSDDNTPADARTVYGNIPQDQVEFLSTESHIISAAAGNAPSEIWETLEHAERVECLNCVTAVAPLLYDSNSETREIAAWWLRRRMFGVFGENEVYQKTLNTLKSDPDPARRANAAYAAGEFLVAPGIDACATAVNTDSDPTVRAAAASALGRLNDDGHGAISHALADTDARVKLAALKSVGRINAFTDTPAVATLLGDASADVRKRSVEILESRAATDSAAAVMAVAKSDADAETRGAACHALGTFHDASTRTTLQDIAAHDTNSLVRDLATIALRRL